MKIKWPEIATIFGIVEDLDEDFKCKTIFLWPRSFQYAILLLNLCNVPMLLLFVLVFGEQVFFLYLAYVNLIVETTFRKQMFKQWSLAATDKSPPNFNSIHR